MDISATGATPSNVAHIPVSARSGVPVWRRVLTAVGAGVLLLGGLLSLFAPQARGDEDCRRVLALYDSRKGPERSSPVHQFLEMPFNRLGLQVEYADVCQRPLPEASAYRCIAIWFTENKVPNAPDYLRWLKRASNSGVRLIVVSGLGVNLEGAAGVPLQPLAQEVWNSLDLRPGPVPFLLDPFQIRLRPTPAHAADFGFEQKELTGELPFYDYRLNGPGLEPWLLVSRADYPDSDAVAVAAGKKGGFISDHQLSGCDVESPVWHYRWYLNPFRFLAAATGVDETPAQAEPAQKVSNLRPDVTTAFGCRAAFSHIDGDGMHNKTQDIPGGQRLAADVLYEKILTSYPVPVTVSYIAAETTAEGGADAPFLDKLRKIMALPNVTPAAHGYTHPMIWDKGVLALKIPGYSYSASMETSGALDLVTRNTCPPAKPAQLLLWTGDCRAPVEALTALAARGFLNMNGGDPRYDRLYDSVSCISALGIRRGDVRQIYAAACNEFLYTDGWKENFGGYASVVETFKNTAEPRYLPVNLYYHNYLCERQAGVISLQRAYNWALSQELCWLTAPEYVRSVMAFFTARTGYDNGVWWIENYEHLNTVRLDRESRHLDFSRSKQVAGYTHFAGSLYISLRPGSRAEIALQPAEGTHLFLRRSTGLLKNIQLAPDRFSGEVRLFAPGFVEIGGLGNASGTARLNGQEVPLEKGRLNLPAGKGEWVALEIRR